MSYYSIPGINYNPELKEVCDFIFEWKANQMGIPVEHLLKVGKNNTMGYSSYKKNYHGNKYNAMDIVHKRVYVCYSIKEIFPEFTWIMLQEYCDDTKEKSNLRVMVKKIKDSLYLYESVRKEIEEIKETLKKRFKEHGIQII